MDLKVRISHAISIGLQECAFDRYEVAARMSRIHGRDVTKNMLDAYSAPSKEAHIPNLAWCIAFDEATGQRWLLKLYARILGCKVLAGIDVVQAEILQLEVDEAEIRRRKRHLKEELLRNRSRR